MVKNSRKGKDTKRVADQCSPGPSTPRTNNPQCLPRYEAHQRPPGFLSVQRVPPRSPNREHFEITWDRETQQICCESSLSFPANNDLPERFSTLFISTASSESRKSVTGLQDSRMIKQEPYTSHVQEHIGTGSEKEVKKRTRGQSPQNPDQQKRVQCDPDPPCLQKLPSCDGSEESDEDETGLLDDGEDSDEDGEEIEREDSYRSVQLVETDEFTRYYDTMFRVIGQLSLKKILKYWIRNIHPKKQGQYPYNGGKFKISSMKLYGETNPGEQTKPPWWPPSLENEKWERARHREPDHQRKIERLVLAVWLLRYFLVEGLEESTLDITPSLEPKFRETVPPMLQKIYNIRRQEEKLNRTNIHTDKTAFVHMATPKLKGKLENTNHPPPPNREPMELPFAMDTPTASRPQTPQTNKNIEQTSNLPQFSTDSYQDFAESRLHLTKRKMRQVTPLNESLSDHFLSHMLDAHGMPDGMSHGIPQPQQYTWGGDTLPRISANPQPPQYTWGDDTMPRMATIPQYQPIPDYSDPSTFDVNEQSYRQSELLFAQQIHDLNQYTPRNSFQ